MESVIAVDGPIRLALNVDQIEAICGVGTRGTHQSYDMTATAISVLYPWDVKN